MKPLMARGLGRDRRLDISGVGSALDAHASLEARWFACANGTALRAVAA